MKSYKTQPRVNGKFVPLITDAQILALQDFCKASWLPTHHRINIRTALKRYVTKADASKELTRLIRMGRQARQAPAAIAA